LSRPPAGRLDHLGARAVTGPAGRLIAFVIDLLAALIRIVRGRPEHPLERRGP
jgi:hypothetical protein